MQEQDRNIDSVKRSVKHLAEAIILQSVEDLWDKGRRKDCLTFFEGTGFIICAEAAGMNVSDRGRLLRMVNRLTGSRIRPLRGYPEETNLEYSTGRG